MKRQFCYICGTKTTSAGPHQYRCHKCQQTFYDNPRPCADLYLINEQGQVLVCRRKFDPGKGQLDMAGGFLDFGETFEEAAVREAAEELGLAETDYSQPQYIGSFLTDYPWGKETYQTAVVAFLAYLKPGVQPTANDDVAEVFWQDIDKINPADFSFPRQIELALRALKALKT